MTEPRALPHSIEVEQALLGALIYDNKGFEACDLLRPDHFFEPFHGRIYEAISKIITRGRSADLALTCETLKDDPALADLGAGYIVDLYEKAPEAANAAGWAEAIIDSALKRGVIAAASAMILEANSAQMAATDVLAAGESRLWKLSETGQADQGFYSFADALRGAVEMTAEAYSRDGGLAGVSCGLIDLDAKVGGLHPSDLIILAGRPSMGKTALATNIAFNVAKAYAFEPQPDGKRKTTAGGVVAFYSLEMSKEQLALRLLSDVSGVSGDRLRKGEIDASEFGRVRDAAEEIANAPIYIDATGGISIAKLIARARKLKRQVGLDLIIVDYLQLVTGSDLGSNANRVQEVSQITMGLKAMAKELGVPVIALSQLSRQVEQREDKRPMLSDLRESGSIEQDADMVWFVYREAYYIGRAEPRDGSPEHLDWQEQMSKLESLAEVIIAKQRHGPIGTVRLSFNSDTTKFGNLEREAFFSQDRQNFRDFSEQSNA